MTHVLAVSQAEFFMDASLIKYWIQNWQFVQSKHPIPLRNLPKVFLTHATTKQAETVGLLEQSHASIKQALEIETGERSSLWHEYASIAVFNFNTSYQTSIGCEPS